MTYVDWIIEHYPTPELAAGQCQKASHRMVEAFPELALVRGHAFVGNRDRPHWWCRTPDGKYVDPTAHQWEYAIAAYTPLPLDHEDPVGKCIECGCWLYKSRFDSIYHCQDCYPTTSRQTRSPQGPNHESCLQDFQTSEILS
jgi:hypothetical protein